MLCRMTALTETQWDTVSHLFPFSHVIHDVIHLIFLQRKQKFLKKTLMHINRFSYLPGHGRICLRGDTANSFCFWLNSQLILLQKRRWLMFVNHMGETRNSIVILWPWKDTNENHLTAPSTNTFDWTMFPLLRMSFKSPNWCTRYPFWIVGIACVCCSG